MLKAGMKAPAFALRDKDGKEVRLSDFWGRELIVYFYPKDNTPGCSRQAAAFAALYAEYKALGLEVIGISRDSESSHVKFASKYSLPFILLSDPDTKTILDYGVWQEKKLYGKVSMGVVRTTFLIDAKGMIEKVWERAKPDTNAGEIMAYLKSR